MLLLGCLGDLLRFEKREIQVARDRSRWLGRGRRSTGGAQSGASSNASPLGDSLCQARTAATFAQVPGPRAHPRVSGSRVARS